MPNRSGVMEQGSRVMELNGGHMGTRRTHPACVTYEPVRELPIGRWLFEDGCALVTEEYRGASLRDADSSVVLGRIKEIEVTAAISVDEKTRLLPDLAVKPDED